MKIVRRPSIAVAALALVLAAALYFIKVSHVAEQATDSEVASSDESDSIRQATRQQVARAAGRFVPHPAPAIAGQYAGSAAPQPRAEACQSCRERECSNYAGSGMDVVKGCTQAVDEKFADKTDSTFIEDCTSFVRCAKQNHCAESPIGAAGCYCGSRNLDDCIANGPGADAPCVEQIRRATRTSSNQELVVRFSDVKYPSGWANYMLQCDTLRCTGTCSREGA